MTLAQDDDWLQRYFIIIRDDEFPMGDSLTVTIAGDRLIQFAAVLQAIVEELKT